MIRLSGEIGAVLENVSFETKEELMTKLREMRRNPLMQENCEYENVLELLGVAIQQAYYTNEQQLLKYKRYLNFKNKIGGTNGKTNN